MGVIVRVVEAVVLAVAELLPVPDAVSAAERVLLGVDVTVEVFVAPRPCNLRRAATSRCAFAASVRRERSPTAMPSAANADDACRTSGRDYDRGRNR